MLIGLCVCDNRSDRGRCEPPQVKDGRQPIPASACGGGRSRQLQVSPHPQLQLQQHVTLIHPLVVIAKLTQVVWCRLTQEDVEDVLLHGMAWTERQGHSWPADAQACEESGCYAKADPSAVLLTRSL